jgi:uncharacterized protein YxeA
MKKILILLILLLTGCITLPTPIRTIRHYDKQGYYIGKTVEVEVGSFRSYDKQGYFTGSHKQN